MAPQLSLKLLSELVVPHAALRSELSAWPLRALNDPRRHTDKLGRRSAYVSCCLSHLEARGISCTEADPRAVLLR